ncbi:MAG: type II CAAX endopeptidase family protein [Bacteroidota bacterium]
MNPFAFFTNARAGKNGWFLYVIGVALVFLANFVGTIPFSVVAWNRGGGQLSPEAMLNPANLGLSPAVGFALMLFPFAVGVVGIWFSIKFFHGRSFQTLTTPLATVNWSKILFSGGLWIGLTALAELAFVVINPDNYQWTFDAAAFFPVLLVALLLIPLQTSMEEWLFRGYLMQGLGLWWKRPFIAMLVTSIAFGLMHWANPEIQAFGEEIILFYVSFGLLMGLTTLMDDSLELALGVHAANNLYGALLVTFPSSALQTPALFTVKEYQVTEMTLAWFVIAGIYLWIVAKKYQWKGWKHIFAPLPTPEPTEPESSFPISSDA